jgi:hypothetical protein
VSERRPLDEWAAQHVRPCALEDAAADEAAPFVLGEPSNIGLLPRDVAELVRRLFGEPPHAIVDHGRRANPECQRHDNTVARNRLNRPCFDGQN